MHEFDSDDEYGLYDAEEVDRVLSGAIDAIGLSKAEKRLLAGHDEPDPICILGGIGNLLTRIVPTEEWLVTIALAMAQSEPEMVRQAVNDAVRAASDAVLLQAGLDPTTSGGTGEEVHRG